MTVATFLQTDMTSQNSTVWKSAVDGDFSVLTRLGVMFAPHESSAPDMVVHLNAGHVFNGATLTEVGAQASSVITAPVSNPRIDRVVINQTTGVLSVITGTPSSAPTAPAITAGTCPVAQFTLNSSDVAITDSMLTDERDFTGLGNGANTSPYGVTTNSGNDYSVTTSPAFASRLTGMIITVKINAANTNSATINANATGIVTCKDEFGKNLPPGTLLANSYYRFLDDGTYWVLINSTPVYKYLPFAPDTGSSNNYAVAPSPQITALSTGMVVLLNPGAANTSTGCTITVAGSTVPQAIKMMDGTDPSSGVMITTGFSELVYKSSYFVLTNPYYAVGVGAGKLVQFTSAAKYPAADGSLITNIPGATRYISSAVTVTPNTVVTLAHSLGAVPKEMALYMVCVSSEEGYYTGDRVTMSAWSETGVPRGACVAADSSNVYLTTAPARNGLSRLTPGGIFNFTDANWSMVAVAKL